MDLLCERCDRSIIENESEYTNYLTSVRKKDDKSLYKKYTINNVNLDEVNKILKDYISSHNKDFDLYFINCEFIIEFIIFKANIKTNCFYNTDILNISLYLSYYINCFKSRGHKFYKINEMTINIISDRCNMSYENYIKKPMPYDFKKIELEYC